MDAVVIGMEGDRFLPADVVCCRGFAWVSRAIRWFTRVNGEEPTKFNHISGFISASFVCEALAKVRIREWTEMEPDYTVWRHEGLDLGQRIAVASTAVEYAGRPYGVGKIVTHALDALVNKAIGGEHYIFRRLNHSPYPICSWLWAHAYDKAIGYRFGGLDPACVSPDDMADHMERSKDWKLIYSRTKNAVDQG